MRLAWAILSNVWPIAILATRPNDGQFTAYQQQFLSSPPLKLDDASYDHLTAVPRNHTLIVLLTALETRYGCHLCRDFHPEWDVLAKSSVKADRRGNSRTLYGTLDVAHGRATFQKLMLQTAPIILLFPPTTGPDARSGGQPIRYEFTAGPQTAEQVNMWTQRYLPNRQTFAIRRAPNYLRIITGTTVILGLLSFLSVAYSYVLPVIQNRNIWAAISLITILLFTSGYMFNHIRKVPYVSGDGKGGISYFAGGFSNQFGMETQIVAAMYGILSFAIIALALKVPRMADPKRQQVGVFVWAAILYGMYGSLLILFRVKNGGYPFYLPPF